MFLPERSDIQFFGRIAHCGPRQHNKHGYGKADHGIVCIQYLPLKPSAIQFVPILRCTVNHHDRNHGNNPDDIQVEDPFLFVVRMRFTFIITQSREVSSTKNFNYLDSKATVSTCRVPGNMSTAQARRRI